MASSSRYVESAKNRPVLTAPSTRKTAPSCTAPATVRPPASRPAPTFRAASPCPDPSLGEVPRSRGTRLRCVQEADAGAAQPGPPPWLSRAAPECALRAACCALCKAARRELTEGVQTKYFLHGAPKTMITMGSPYFVWINTNEIISSWYLLGAVCVPPPCSPGAGWPPPSRRRRPRGHRSLPGVRSRL